MPYSLPSHCEPLDGIEGICQDCAKALLVRVAELSEVASGNRLRVLQQRNHYRDALERIMLNSNTNIPALVLAENALKLK